MRNKKISDHFSYPVQSIHRSHPPAQPVHSANAGVGLSLNLEERNMGLIAFSKEINKNESEENNRYFRHSKILLKYYQKKKYSYNLTSKLPVRREV